MSNRPSKSRLPTYPFYPAYCHSVSPTFGRWCPLRAKDVFGLNLLPELEGQAIYYYKNHPIQWIRLTGVVVAIDNYDAQGRNGVSRWVATIDDSSGHNIEAVCTAPPRLPIDLEATDIKANARAVEPLSFISPDGPDLTGIDVGSVVKIKGGISEYRGNRQIRLLKLWRMGDTNTETKAWEEVVAFRKEVLNVPWVVTEEQQKQCREEQSEEKIIERTNKAEAEQRRLKRQLKRKQRELEEKKREEDEKLAARRRRREMRRQEMEGVGANEGRSRHRTSATTKPEMKSKTKPVAARDTLVLSRAARLMAAGKFDALGL